MTGYQTPYYGGQIQQPPMQQPQIVNGGFISVRSEQEARNYPIAHGNSLTFKDENAPYVYTKTMGFSQMDVPVFEKFRLIRETDATSTESVPKEKKDEMGALKRQVDSLKQDVKVLMDFMAEFGGGEDE